MDAHEIRVLFFPGRNTPIKRYRSYFPTLELSVDEPHPTVILCHSAGIVPALAYSGSIPIIAMDPSVIPENKPQIKAMFVRQGREIPPNALNVILYSEQTHMPYMFRNLRNQIVDACQHAIPFPPDEKNRVQ